MKKKIAVTTTSFGKYDSSPLDALRRNGFEVVLNSLGRRLGRRETLNLCGPCTGIIAGTEVYDAGVLKRLSLLRVISRCGTGIDNIDQGAAGKMGIKIFNTPDSPVPSVSELTVGLMLDLLRKISLMDSNIRKGKWNKKMGQLLRGKKVGIVGFGRVGREVARLLRLLGCEMAYADTRVNDGVDGFDKKPFFELLKWSDIVSVHVSGSRMIIGKGEMRRMKRGALVINTSRGAAIDEGALYKLLKEGHLSGAALDVFKKEPYKGRLKGLDNVVLTPHAGSYAVESRISMEARSVDNLLAHINEVN